MNNQEIRQTTTIRPNVSSMYIWEQALMLKKHIVGNVFNEYKSTAKRKLIATINVIWKNCY